jgi:hypothetical protein
MVYPKISAATHTRARSLPRSSQMVKFETVGVSYGRLRKDCLDTVRQWPGCETVSGIQIIRDNTPAGFSLRITLYGRSNRKIADRAMISVQREMRRHFHLTE